MISCGCCKHLTSALESLTVCLDELTLQFHGSLLDARIWQHNQLLCTTMKNTEIAPQLSFYGIIDGVWSYANRKNIMKHSLKWAPFSWGDNSTAHSPCIADANGVLVKYDHESIWPRSYGYWPFFDSQHNALCRVQIICIMAIMLCALCFYFWLELGE